MTPQSTNLAEAICEFQRSSRGAGCSDPLRNPGTCGACQGIAETVRLFGAGITVDEKPVQLPHAGPCHICQRAAVLGLNFKGKPLCASCSPYPHAGELMLNFSETEEEAIEAGGAEGGGYLDSINKTDLATLTEKEWHTFLCKVLGGYSEFMREEVKKYPPF